jgi:murE/murF fusion protein
LSSGAANVLIEVDRAQAILHAVLSANAEDIVLLAGKGHEAYQEVSGQRTAFDDGQWAQAGLMLRQECSVQTDSRKLDAGSVFVALRGDNFDGHDYLEQVAASGAVAAIVDQTNPQVALPQIALGDTRTALLTLGRAWRKKFVLPIIAVTGSNGKTTTKEMIASILAEWVGEPNRLATMGNLNNELGVPLTLLRLRSHHQVAVIELGMNHPGEIAVLGGVTLPTVALVNNAQREHQEFMVSVEAVARENAAVFDSLMPGGVKVYPADDTFTTLWNDLSGQHASSTFGLTAPARVWASDIDSDVLGSSFVLHTPVGQAEIALPVPGMHNVRNALAATACALASGASLASVVQGLQKFRAANGRMQPHRLQDGRVLIDDTYNANPDSVRAAIDVLASLPAPRVLVLGDMGEVGDNGPAMHTEVGAYARSRGIDTLLTLGEATRASALAFGQGARHCDSPEQICEMLGKMVIASLLVKGSRFMRMERVVRGYTEQFGTTPGEVVKHAV